MNSALAAALAREAIKKRPEWDKADTNAHKQGPKEEVKPERWVSLKKSEMKTKGAFEVNSTDPVILEVELKKVSIKEKRPPESAPPVFPSVELRNTPVKSSASAKQASKSQEPQIMVQLRKTEKVEKAVHGVNSSGLPSVNLRHAETSSGTTSKEHLATADFGVQLRKPGQRKKHLEKYYQ